MGITSGSNFELSDNRGSTVVYNGTANTTPANVPSVADKVISGFGMTNTGSQSIQISMDGGSTYFTVKKGIFFSWDLKGERTQLQIKTVSSTSTYELIINFEDK